MAGVGRKKAAIIEIDQNNFQQQKPNVQSAIRQSAFVAFDCEFTGLHRERQQGATVLLSARSRYAHLRQEMFGGGFLVGKCQCGTELMEASNYCHHCGASQRTDPSHDHPQSHKAVRRQEFLIAQVGIACYIYNDERKTYDIKCFSFYLSPRPWSGGGGNVKIEHDIRFSCMGSSLKFLGDHSFDFNRWINDGIPFMSRHQYTMEKEKHHKRGQYANLKELDTGKGFLEIWDLLITSGKPLVGHQCFLDILYLWHQLEGPLSKDLSDVFKELHSKVKIIVDTKHLLTWYPKDLTTMCEKEAVSVRQLKLNRLKADLAEKERLLKENKEKMGGEDVTSRGSTPARDGAVSPVPSAGDNLKNKQDEKEELQRRSSEIHTAIKEKVFREMLKQLKGEDLGNRFRSMQLHEIYKLVFPVIQDAIPSYSAREHDAGYDAYMTGAVFLAVFMLIHDSTVVPTSKTILDNHTYVNKKRDPGSPQSFNFINKIHIFAAPYYLETSALQLPALDESHTTTYVIGGGDGASHIEVQRLQNDIKKVDSFGEIYWIEFQKRCAVILFRRDITPAELYKKLQDAVAPLQVTCAVKPKKLTPSANALALLKTQLSKKKALAIAQSSNRQPKSPTGPLTVQVDACEGGNGSPISSSASPRVADDSPSVNGAKPLADLLPMPPLPKRRSKRPLSSDTTTGTLKSQKVE